MSTACTFTQNGHGELGFRINSEWAFYHRANQDDGMLQASSNTEFPSLESWMFESTEEDDSSPANGAGDSPPGG